MLDIFVDPSITTTLAGIIDRNPSLFWNLISKKPSILESYTDTDAPPTVETFLKNPGAYLTTHQKKSEFLKDVAENQEMAVEILEDCGLVRPLN